MRRSEPQSIDPLKTSPQRGCINPKCENPIKSPPLLFQNMPVCSTCKRILDRHMENARRDLKNIMVTYINLLRESLVDGKIDFPVLPRQRTMPGPEFGRALQNLRRAHGSKVQGANGESAVSTSGLQGNPDHKDG